VTQVIASLDIASFLNEAHELGQTILQSEEAKHYLRSRTELGKDQEAQALIRSFVKKKEEFEEVERFGKYHPDHDRVKKEMRELKRTMDMNDNVVQFKKAERELESILNEVSKIVAFAVSEDIKIPTGNPFWDQSGCGGSGCGSGGCGNGG
jgi:cell fate (sporulation/competence/biofilm development) regulator YlbF (YheA/YmcA/DUF963 family)